METLECVCYKCQQPLATFTNLWTKLSNYFIPVLDAIGEVQITTKGSARIGKTDTLVAECKVQEIACIGCDAVIGLKCLRCPINHVLEDSQILLRQTSVHFLGPNGGTVELKVRRKLRLQRCSGSKPEQLQRTFHDYQHHDLDFDDDDGGSLESDFVDLGNVQAGLEAQQEQIERIGNAAYQKVSRFDDVISRIDSRVKKLNESITELQIEINVNKRDIATANADISEVKLTIHQKPATAKFENKLQEACSAIINLEKLCKEARNEAYLLHKGLQVIKDDVRRLENASTSLRQELVTAKKAARDSLNTAKDNTKELTSLKVELKKLKDGMSQNRSQPHESKSQSLMPRELDILTNNITKIGNRASLVDSLQMEVDLLKSRVQRLEGNVEFPALRNHEHPLKLSHPEEYSKGLETAEDPSGKITPAKLGPNQSDNSSDENGEPSSARPHLEARKRKTPSDRSRRQESAKSPRLTKSGTIDKRTIKKQNQNCSADASV